jgi:hypothetical protein
VAQAARTQAATMAGWLSAGLRLTRGASLDPDAIRIPDSAIARSAEELCEEMQPAFVANHAHRSYLWGALLAQLDRLTYDAELFYVAALLHDTGLDPARGDSSCFTVASARVAEREADEARWSPERRDSLAEAITLHLNPRVSLDQGAEAHLLSAGVTLDNIGQRYHELDRTTVGRVLERHPRVGYKHAFAGLWRAEAKASPASRAHMLRLIGFGLAIRLAPFRE